MNQELANYFFEQAANAFHFLVNSNTFGPPQFEVDKTVSFATVTFMAKNLAVECILDEREAEIDCRIALVVDGHKSPFNEIDEKGTRVRSGLFRLLRKRGIREPLFTPNQRVDLHDRIKVTLRDFAKMLQIHGQDILADSPTALA